MYEESYFLVSQSASDTNDAFLEPHGPAAQDPLPEKIGRYAIQRRLGKGGFGVVYLAQDTQLQRLVALKIPVQEHFSSEAQLDCFIEEARTAAQLHHPAIVAVYDVSREGDKVFIIQQYVAGESLASHLRSHRVSPEQAARLMVTAAEAVAFAHQKGFVHRDLKPSNILLNEHAQPHVADFGLAIHETVQRRRRGERSGTPAYMSPEQVRGETHRLDGRSDTWSLGVILYHMFAGRCPFGGESRSQLFDEIQHRDPTPPRQFKPELPAELERICLKCLSKRATERYSSAADLASDLRHWLAGDQPQADKPAQAAAAKIVPKGLRSFGAEDADFFLDLLPGPRDRSGLPESIRFWKTRIEQTDADSTFTVGLIYGPTGCGKSSLVKAGLLPRLGSHVLPIYVEATAEDTEARLLKALHAVYHDKPSGSERSEVPVPISSVPFSSDQEDRCSSHFKTPQLEDLSLPELIELLREELNSGLSGPRRF